MLSIYCERRFFRLICVRIDIDILVLLEAARFNASFARILFIAFDPFTISLSRLLHLDGLVSALMLLSLLAFMRFLYQSRRWLDLLVSAVAAG